MTVRILIGDALEQLKTLPDESVHCCVSSPPYYGLRCYGTDGQIGLEPTPDAHIAALVEVFREVRRVLRKDGVCWMNYGDAYATANCGGGSVFDNGRTDGRESYEGDRARGRRGRDVTLTQGYKSKDLLMMPSRVALALQANGWWLRSMMPWVKRSAMPESVTDRPATAIEYVFLLTKSARYFWDGEAVRQGDQVYTRKAGGYDNHHQQGASRFGGKGGFGDSDVTTVGRNFRNSDLFYASLQPPHGLIYADDPLALDVNPAGFADAHFATFPPKLIEPLIKAATSEKGCCAECGAPWERETAKSYGEDNSSTNHIGSLGQGWEGYQRRASVETKTLGWSPSCECGAETVPCVVLDPFMGAGTTGLVADRLGRDSIGVELNPDYAAMARTRIDTDAATRGTGPQDVMRGDDLPLFTEAT